MVAQNTLKNSSTSRHKSNYDFCRQSKKSKINSQPNLSFSYKTCGCLTPLHQKRKWSQVKYSRLSFYWRPIGPIGRHFEQVVEKSYIREVQSLIHEEMCRSSIILSERFAKVTTFEPTHSRFKMILFLPPPWQLTQN